MSQCDRFAERFSVYVLDTLESRLMLAATKVVFASAPLVVPAGATSPAITIQLQDGAGAAAPAGPGGQTVSLSTSSDGGTFLDGADAPITSVLVPAGASSASFKYTDTVA